MSSLVERIMWVLIEHQEKHPARVAEEVIKEIETTHKVCNPEDVTDTMVEECFNALPNHYNPPDPKRRPWHRFKAIRRYTAMVKSVKSVLEE